MEIVVTFGDGVVRGCDDRSEEVGLCEWNGLELELPDEVLEDAELFEGQPGSLDWQDVHVTHMPDKWQTLDAQQCEEDSQNAPDTARG